METKSHEKPEVYLLLGILPWIGIGSIRYTAMVRPGTSRSGGSPGNLDTAVLIPSAFIAGHRSLGSHNDKFVSFSAKFPLFSTR